MPYERDMNDSLDEIADLFITPLLNVPASWNGYDAYTRQSNVLILEFERILEEFRKANKDWKHEGGVSPKLCTFKGVTTLAPTLTLVSTTTATLKPVTSCFSLRKSMTS